MNKTSFGKTLKTTMQNTPSVNTPNSTIKIIGAGMPRTGTMSLKVALETLGYSECYHMVDLMQNLSDVEDWESASKGETVDWSQLFEGYQAVVDIPGQRYYQELMEAYPDAKVVMTTRDPSRWYESVKDTIYQAHSFNEIANSWWWLRYPLSSLRKNKLQLGRLIGKILWDDYFEQQFEDKDFVISVYEKHLEAVKQHVPADQLLVFDVAEGWETLCDFLDLPLPKGESFPHANDREQFQQFWLSLDTDIAGQSTEARTLAEQVALNGLESPEQTCLINNKTSLTCKELDVQSNKVAQVLKNLGLTTGDRVAIFLPNGTEFVSSYIGIHKAGGVVTTVNTTLTTAEIDHILSDSQTRIVITTTVLQAQINRSNNPELKQVFLIDEPHSLTVGQSFEAVTMSADDPAMLLYTSGTTGKPKAAVLSHGNLLASASTVAKELALDSNERVLIFLPMFHCYGLITALSSALYSKATLVILPEFESKQVLKTISEQQITTVFAVPTIYTLLANEANLDQLASVKQYISAGANLPLETAQQWQEKFNIPITNGLGFTEGAHVTFNTKPLEKAGSVGLPLSGINIKIVDDEGLACAPNCLGEVIVSGPNIMLGYWNQQEAIISNGWFHTGDIGHLDDDGYLYISDRRTDRINVGGEKVYPNEVEQILYSHPAIKDAAVFGIPHSVMNEEVRASITLNDNQRVTEKEVIDYCRDQLAHFKLPSSIEFLDSLPRNKTGKILKRVLRERFVESSDSKEQATLRQELQNASSAKEQTALLKQQVKLEIHRITGVELRDQESILETGMDSLMSIQLTCCLSSSLGISLPTTLALEYTTVNKLTEHLTELFVNSTTNDTAHMASQKESQDIYNWFPQSYIQRLYYSWHEAAENKAFMNMNFAVRVRSQVNNKCLKAALQTIVNRHAALRLVYDQNNGVPVQRVQKHQDAFFVEKQVQCTDWAEVRDDLLKESRRPFVLQQDATMRMYLFSRAPDDHILLVVRHHIVNDRSSGAIVLNELFQCYQEQLTGSEESPSSAPSYLEFLNWHDNMLKSPDGQAHKAYWQQQLGHKPDYLRLPTDFPRHSKNRHYGDALTVEIPEALTSELKQLAKSENTSLYTVMMTAYQILFHFHTGQQEILVDTSMINRTQTQFEKTVGQVSIMQTICTSISEDDTFTNLLQQVQKTVWEALRHQSYPSQLLIEDLQLSEGYVYNRPGQTLFNLVSENFSQISLEKLSQYGLALEPTTVIPAGSSGTFHEINTQFLEKDGKLSGYINFETDLYKKTTIENLMNDYTAILKQILSNPSQTISALKAH